jgi:hypothetical protein
MRRRMRGYGMHTVWLAGWRRDLAALSQGPARWLAHGLRLNAGRHSCPVPPIAARPRPARCGSRVERCLLDRLRRPEAALDACRAGRTIGRQGDVAYQSVRRQLVWRLRGGLACICIGSRAEEGGRAKTAVRRPQPGLARRRRALDPVREPDSAVGCHGRVPRLHRATTGPCAAARGV